MGRRSSAYFDRNYNAWTVARHDTSRAGLADSYSTYDDKQTAERVAREENEAEESREDARRTITHNETVQALKDVAEYQRRFPNEPYSYNWFVVRFNLASDQAKSRGWKWEIYQDAVRAALDASKSKPTSKKQRSAHSTKFDAPKPNMTVRQINAVVNAADGRNVYLIRERMGAETVQRVIRARTKGRETEVRSLATGHWIPVLPERGDRLEVR